MKLKILGTGSTGNCYLFYDKKISFIIDCGISFKEILTNIPPKTDFKGIFITHEHSDHAKAVNDCLKYGFRLFCSKGTADALGLHKRDYVKISKYNSIYDKINDLEIIPFKVKHNANEPLGFLISYKGTNTLFATDCNKIGGSFPNVTNFIIEGNHSFVLMEKDNVNFNAYQNHMSIENAVKFVERNKGLQAKQVILIHLSRRNADHDTFKAMMQNTTEIPTYVAKKNSKFDLNGVI